MGELLSRSQWLPAGGPGLARGRGAGFLFHRGVPGRGPGLTVPREALWLSAPLAASVSRFAAALTSRSRVRPQLGQVYVRSDRGSLVFTVPQPEQVLELGNHRLAMISCPPCQLVLEPSLRRACPNPWSAMARASRWLRVIPATFRSSATTVSYRVARSVVTVCSAPLRTLAARAWMRASRAADLRRLALPCSLREWARLARRSLRSDERSAFGPVTVTTFPRSSIPVSRALTPRSMPMALPGRAWTSGSR